MSPQTVRTYRPQPGWSVRPPDLEPEQRDAVRAADPLRPPKGRHRYELPVLVVLALALAFLIKTFLVQAFFIPSGSMIPTLEIGDRVLVEKVSYRFTEPERGDVIVFRRPGVEEPTGIGPAVRSFFEGLGLLQPDEDIDLIKRIVGLPGETVEVRDGIVHVAGVAVDEPYALLDERDFPPHEVAPGEYFMLGDNRANSDDSRYGLGTVPTDNIVGRAFVILWPPGNVTLELGHPLEPAVD
jgi:signal peptidase I